MVHQHAIGMAIFAFKRTDTCVIALFAFDKTPETLWITIRLRTDNVFERVVVGAFAF